MKLWINDELKQSAKTDAMINDIATQVSFLSHVTTLVSGRFDYDRKPRFAGVSRKAQAGRCFESRNRRHRGNDSRRCERELGWIIRGRGTASMANREESRLTLRSQKRKGHQGRKK